MSASEEKVSPMLAQYLKIKEKYKDCVVFFRLGDFYEMFYEEAEKISRELELTLTARAGVPMCGVPYHACEVYLKKLIDKGYKVALCEQLQDPATTKGLVERDVIRLVTPGTLYEDSMLDESRNNFIACFYAEGDSCGVVFADISTGEFHLCEKSGNNICRDIESEISRYVPSEILFNEKFLDYKEVHDFLRSRIERVTVEMLDDEKYSTESCDELTEQYLGDNKHERELGDFPLGKKALYGVFRYINDTQKAQIKRYVTLTVHYGEDSMSLPLTTRRNLELTETMRSKDRKGSLLWVLDKTKTAMGRRKLRRFIEQPLLNVAVILHRLTAVNCLFGNYPLCEDIREVLSGIYDLERLMSRIVYRAANPKDVVALGRTCEKIPALKELLSQAETEAKLFKKLNLDIDELSEIAELIRNAIKDEPPAQMKDGGYINDGFNEELDRLRDITNGGKNILEEIEAREKEATGIKNLRVRYNRVFGYYIEVSKGNISLVPDHYIRKQTLTNGERYITEELKQIENEILGANDKILALEAEIFAEVREFIAARLVEVQRTAEAIAYVDVLQSYATVSRENDYVKPDISLENVIEIHDGRHPVIEKIRNDNLFTPNNTLLDTEKNRMCIITGPNMAGKSTYMRQVAIITLMAQIGCFVPAKSARIGLVDSIYTRVGASDDLAAGQSTFMVEMTEVAEILKGATDKSLVILDEIGRGTSTFDGISIAKSVAEYINNKIGCKTLFATHYHELIALEKENDGIRNYSVAVTKKGDDIKFLHKIVEGGTDNSYGIEVAKLAGVPDSIINRAKVILAEVLESGVVHYKSAASVQNDQLSLEGAAAESLMDELKNIDATTLTPIEAMKILYDLTEKAKNI